MELFNGKPVILDGGMGTLLQKKGLKPGERPERWNVTHPEVIIAIHRAYFDAGSNIVNTNTFGANILNYDENELEQVVNSAVVNAKSARGCDNSKYIALDLGPTGKMLKPYGELDFEDAVEIFAKTIRIARNDVDLIMIETFTDLLETKAAVIAAKENSDKPIFVSNAYEENGNLLCGATPEAVITTLEGLGVSAMGVNCSAGPDKLAPILEKYLKNSSVPVIFKPNAGLPTVIDGRTVFSLSAEDFAFSVANQMSSGAEIVGGCCGTTPEYIRALVEKIGNSEPEKRVVTKKFRVSSYRKVYTFGEKCAIIGERINPTGKKKFKQALIDGNIDYILGEAISQEQAGADILDVNVGIPDIDEKEVLPELVQRLQAVTSLPLQLDSSDPVALEKAMRVYRGKPVINSVNGSKKSIEAILPLVKKYGGAVVALALDEKGIPADFEGKFGAIQKIIDNADFDLEMLVDPLTMTIGTDKDAAKNTLDAVRRLAEKGFFTVLGLSNVSFGLPDREAINSAFLTLALQKGLTAAIINPLSKPVINAYHGYYALSGEDFGIPDYISAMSDNVKSEAVEKNVSIEDAIFRGLKGKSAEQTRALLAKKQPLDIITQDIIPALNRVGEDFAANKIFLPQLLMSADAAGLAFAEIKNSCPDVKATKEVFVLATVKGDVHDIGKNIVKMLLENYGYDVRDLGKDVPPEIISEAVKRLNAPFLGLSALMTTTVPAMEDTIKLVRKSSPDCKIVVGGAVLTADYAEKIGADFYAKDATDTVRFAEKWNKMQ